LTKGIEAYTVVEECVGIARHYIGQGGVWTDIEVLLWLCKFSVYNFCIFIYFGYFIYFVYLFIDSETFLFNFNHYAI